MEAKEEGKGEGRVGKAGEGERRREGRRWWEGREAMVEGKEEGE